MFCSDDAVHKASPSDVCPTLWPPYDDGYNMLAAESPKFVKKFSGDKFVELV